MVDLHMKVLLVDLAAVLHHMAEAHLFHYSADNLLGYACSV